MGSNFVRFLYHKYPDYQIFNLDALTYAGNPENLADIETDETKLSQADKRYVFIKGDICDFVLLENLFDRYTFDLIFHFAAETHVDRSIFNVADFIRTNIEGTRSLLEIARKRHSPRFVHISTDEVYGSVPKGFSKEDAPLRPSNPYSTSKAGADMLVQAYIKTYHVPALIVRGSNNFGPYQYPEKLIPLAISNMIEGTKIPVHGSGQHVRSWLHVQDFCSAVDLVAHEGVEGDIYNVSGEPRTNVEVLQVIANYLGKNLDTHKNHINDRPAADLRYAPDSSKLQEALGWSRKYTLAASLDNVVKWYLDNRDWWQKIKLKKEFLDHYQKQSKAQWY